MENTKKKIQPKTKKEVEIVEKEIVSIPFIQEPEIDDSFIEKLERNIINYRKLITLALKLTNEQDWTNQNGKPYLDASGAEKIANPFGICIRDQRSQRREFTDAQGTYYVWEYTARFSSAKLGRDIEVSGMASSRDKFFAKVTSTDKDGRKITVLKPLEEVDQVNIMKKAQTNMIVNGIKRCIGLRNLTWEQLEEAGLKKEKIISIQYADKTYDSKQKLEQKKAEEKTEKKEKLFG